MLMKYTKLKTEPQTLTVGLHSFMTAEQIIKGCTVESKNTNLCAFSSLELGSDGNWLGFETKQKAIAAGKVKLQAMRDSNQDTFIEHMITNGVGEVCYAASTIR